MTAALDFTHPHVLRNESEYAAAVAEVDRLLDADPAPGCVDYERLEFLSVLIEAYEESHFPLDQLTTPQDVVDFMLEQKGLTRHEVNEWLGGEGHALAFFNRTRSLSLSEIKTLRERLGVPADLLVDARAAT